ncbi:MAG: 16S rRNA (uracil(1498)-N(3))-methyltransferase [Proteobacteria bacterium]|nr:16S rRNA (uracil(1498)-N(3))-methyltransferase [Pseudomonadota bacterium]
MEKYRYIPRFYGCYLASTGWQIPPSEGKHLKVLKIKSGEIIELCNGKGREARVRMLALPSRGELSFEVISENTSPPMRPQIQIYVIGDFSGEISRYIAPMTELGLSTIGWLSNKKDQGVERWQRLAIAAIKQSKSPYFLQIKQRSSLEECLAHDPEECRWVVDPSGPRFLADELVSWQRSVKGLSREKTEDKKHRLFTFYLGDRSGFKPKDMTFLCQEKRAHLGPHILRLPTAIQCVASLSRQILGFS